MNKKIVTILFISAAFFLNACQKNSDVFVPDPGQNNTADTTWKNTISATAPVFSLHTNSLLEPVRDSFEVSPNPVTIITANGVQITFPANCCVGSAGQAITGKVYIEVLLIKKKGDMVLMNKPTSSNGRVLVSGGELFISLSKNGQALQLAPNAKLQIRYADVLPSTQMKLFVGDETVPARFNWLPAQDSNNNFVNAGLQFYEITTNHLRWINCDYFYDTTGITRSTVSTGLASNYTNANTAAFVVFKDFRTVMALNADVPERRFLSPKIPNGKLAVVVVLSKQGNDYFLAKETITTGVNVSTANNLKISLTPVKTSLADIKLYLSTL